MALFESKKKAPKAKKEKTTTKAGASAKVLSDSKLEGILSHPWMSEKALIGTEKGVYVFAVPARATKREIALAVERFYKVVPTKVNVLTLPAKMKPMRKKRGRAARAARHKAYVYLKKGDAITF